MTINEAAAQWWLDRFGLEGKKDELRAAFLKHLPDEDWYTYNDYDPNLLLLRIVQEVVPDCRGCMFSGDGLFPRKTGLRREGNKLSAKEGYGGGWHDVPVNAE